MGQAHYSIHILKAELRFALFSESVLLIGGSWSCLPFRLVFSLVHPMSIGWYWMHKRKRNFGRQNSSEPPTQSKGRTLTIEQRAFVFPLHHCLTFASQKMICIFRQRSLPSFLPSYPSAGHAMSAHDLASPCHQGYFRLLSHNEDADGDEVELSMISVAA